MQVLTDEQRIELFNGFQIMLEEAGTRGTAKDAVVVIAGMLQDFSHHNSGLSKLSNAWNELSRCVFEEAI